MSGRPTSIKRKGVPKGLDLKASIGTPTGAKHVGGADGLGFADTVQGSFVQPRAAPITPPAISGLADYQFDAPNPGHLSDTTVGAPIRPPRRPIPLDPHEQMMDRPDSAMSNNEYYDANSTPVASFRDDNMISPTDPGSLARSTSNRTRSEEMDVTGNIAFRQGPTTPTRTLYSAPLHSRRASSGRATYLSEIPMPSRAAIASSPIRSTTLPDMVGVDGRRPSLVNPEDYVPGYAITTDGGKAMTAGFEKPASPSRAARNANYITIHRPSYSSSGSSSSAVRRGSTLRMNWDDQPSFERSSNGLDLVVSEDVAESSAAIIYNAEEQKNTESTAAQEAKIMPSLLYDRARLSEAIPRDPITGKIDWRARLSVKGTGSRDASPTAGVFIDKDGLFESPMGAKFDRVDSVSSVGSYNEKRFYAPDNKDYFTSTASIGQRKPVIQIIEREAPEYTWLGRLFLYISPATFFFSILAVSFYLFVRAVAIVRASRQMNELFIPAWLFYAFECTMALWMVLHNFGNLTRLSLRTMPRYTIKGDVCLPTVDVLVICTGQDTSMIMDAVVACAHLDWPVDKLRILVIDEDGADATRRAVDYYSNNRALHVTYHRRQRTESQRKGILPKSSTINFGLAETRANGRVSGEFVLVLEAESMCESDCLRVTLPHMIKNPLVALLSTSSGYYTLPNRLGLSFGTFFRCAEPSKDARSGFLMRRCAIDDIGGMPTKSSVEDGRLEYILEGKGYRTLRIEETVQYSAIPDSFSHHLRQRTDRDIARMKTAARLGFFIGDHRVAHMPLSTRLRGLARAIAPFTSVVMFVAMLTLPVAYASGGFLVPSTTLGELNLMVWAAFAMIVTGRLHDFFFTTPVGKPSVHRYVQAQIFLAPYRLVGLMRMIVPSVLLRAQKPHWISPSDNASSERDAKNRTSLGRRLLSVTFAAHSWLHAIFLLALVGCIGLSLAHSILPWAQHQRSAHQTGLLVLMTVAWPTLPWLDMLLACAAPFIYACFPPTVASREQLLHREPITGLARPLPGIKRTRPIREGLFGRFALFFVQIIYICAVFALTFTPLV